MNCNKIGYLSKKEAAKEMNKINSSRKKNNRQPLTMYKCRNKDCCYLYHLTSWTKEKTTLLKMKMNNELPRQELVKINNTLKDEKKLRL